MAKGQEPPAGIDENPSELNSPHQPLQSQKQPSDLPVQSDNPTNRRPAPLSGPLSLDALIPQSAGRDAGDWAAQGVDLADLPQTSVQSASPNQFKAPARDEPTPDALLDRELSERIASPDVSPDVPPAPANAPPPSAQAQSGISYAIDRAIIKVTLRHQNACPRLT